MGRQPMGRRNTIFAVKVIRHGSPAHGRASGRVILPLTLLGIRERSLIGNHGTSLFCDGRTRAAQQECCSIYDSRYSNRYTMPTLSSPKQLKRLYRACYQHRPPVTAELRSRPSTTMMAAGASPRSNLERNPHRLTLSLPYHLHLRRTWQPLLTCQDLDLDGTIDPAGATHQRFRQPATSLSTATGGISTPPGST